MKLFNDIQEVVDEEKKRMAEERRKASLVKREKEERRNNPDINRIIRNLPAFLERAALDGCHTGIHTLNVMTLNEENHLIITDSMKSRAQRQSVSGIGQIADDYLLEGEIEIRNILQKSVIPLIDYLEEEGFEVSIKSQNKDDPGAYCPTMEHCISVSW